MGLFLDEPLSNLDAVLRVQTRVELKRLFAELGTTAIYVTHDQAEAMTMSDRIAIFARGRLQQVGTPLEIYRAPVNRFVAGFVGSPPMTVLEGTVEDTAIRFAGLSVPRPRHLPNGESGRPVLVGLRAEDVALDADGQEATVDLVEHLGSAAILSLRSGGATLLAQVSENTRARRGDAVRLRLDPDKLYLFDRRTEDAIVTPGTTNGFEDTP